MSKFSAAVVGLMAAVVLAAPASAENVLRWASVGGALTADPHAYSESPTSAQLSQVYDVLIGLDSNLELAPRLATSWRLVDPTTWELELRPNRQVSRWHAIQRRGRGIQHCARPN
jgi:peptide/nickel transport system substrate-binding protein